MLASSAIVLISEVVAVRVIAPYIGLTLETFSAVIGCVLAGISLGSGVGGWLADRTRVRTLLTVAFALGGVSLIASPYIVRAFGPAAAPSGPRGALVLAAAGFLVPSVALSAVTPTVLRSIGRRSSRLGAVAGAVSAVGTAGALIGTFGSGFVLIGEFRSAQILVLCGVASLVLAAASAYALGEPRFGRATTPIVLVVVAVAGSLLGDERACDAETKYVCLNIDEIAPATFHFRSDVYTSSVTDVANPRKLHFAYLRDVSTVVELVAPNEDTPLRFAYIGGGGYTLPLYFEAGYTRASHVVYEIDEELVQRVTSVLGVDDSMKFPTRIGDARIEVAKSTPDSADIVIGDAFSGIAVPWHLTTAEFLEDVRALLAPDGLYVMNLIDRGALEFARAETRTFRSVFHEVVAVAPADVFSGRDARPSNVLLLGGADLPDVSVLNRALSVRGADAIAIGGNDVDVFIDGASALTDEFAPVDQLLRRL